MWAVIMYEPPNRDNCQHNICSAVCFEYMLAACTGAVQLSPFFLTDFFILNSMKITVVESNLYCLSLSKSVHL